MQVVFPGEPIERDRQRQRDVGAPLHQPQDPGQEKHQHDIERQHVHVEKTKSQQQCLNDGDAGLLEKIIDAHFLRVQRVVEPVRGVDDFRKENREQEHVGHVDLPDPAQDPCGRDHEAGLAHGAAVDKGRGVAGDEDENLGGVAESVATDGEPGQKVW